MSRPTPKGSALEVQKAVRKLLGSCGNERGGFGGARVDPGAVLSRGGAAALTCVPLRDVLALNRLSPSFSSKNQLAGWPVSSQKLRHFQSEERVSLVKYTVPSLLQNLHYGKA